MLRSVGSTWAVTITQIVVVFAVTPYAIGVLGDDRYGIWLTITSLTGYLLLVAGGLPAASVRYLSESIGGTSEESRAASVNRVVHSALYLYGVVSAACVLLGLLLYAGWVLVGREVPDASRVEAHVAFLLVVLRIAMSFVAHLPLAVLEAHDQFVRRNLVGLGSLLLQATLTFVLLWAFPSIVSLAVSVFLCIAAEIVAGVALARRQFPAVTFGIAQRDGALTRKLVHYSAWVLVLALGGRLAFNTDAVIISTMSSYEAVAHYNVPNSLALYFMEFLAAVAIVVMPRAARLRAGGDADGLRATFLLWSKVSMSLTLVVGLFLFFMGPAFIAFWINDEYASHGAAPLRWLVGSLLFFLPMRGAAVPVLMGVGDVTAAAIAYLGMGIANVVASILLVKQMGIVGAAIGTAVPNVLFAVVVFRLACTETQTAPAAYLRYAVTRPLVASLPVVAWLALCTFVFDARGFWGLLYSGTVTVALHAWLQLRFAFRDDPYVDVLAHPRIRAVAARLGLA